ncbi:MAG: hypothetical protein ACPHDO_03780 [Candidatus Poseidoniaceae archaeon]
MLEEVNVLVAASGLGGLVAGYIVGRFFGGNSQTTSSQDFTRKQMDTWNINEEWYNILSIKKKEEFAQSELDKLNDYVNDRVAERKELRKRQDAVIEQVKEVKQLVERAESEFEQKAIISRMGDISGEHSTIRRAFDKVTNALVNSEQSKSFLEFVMAGKSKNQITKEMNHSNVRNAIKNNEGLAMEMFDAEMRAFGNARDFAEAKRALNIDD